MMASNLKVSDYDIVAITKSLATNCTGMEKGFFTRISPGNSETRIFRFFIVRSKTLDFRNGRKIKEKEAATSIRHMDDNSYLIS